MNNSTNTIRIFCNECRRETRHSVMRSFEEQPGQTGDITNWHVMECAGCATVSVLEQHSNDASHPAMTVDTHVYPPRRYRPTKHFPGAPASVDSLYRDTIDLLNTSFLLFVAGGLRALVEAICADQGVTDGPKRDIQTGQYQTKKDGSLVRCSALECKIEGLAERRILTERQAMTLHEHRFLGNMALHELDVPDKATLETALNIVEHVMDALYSIPLQAAGLQNRRQAIKRTAP